MHSLQAISIVEQMKRHKRSVSERTGCEPGLWVLHGDARALLASDQREAWLVRLRYLWCERTDLLSDSCPARECRHPGDADIQTRRGADGGGGGDTSSLTGGGGRAAPRSV
ncbi:hypothetical protein RB195_001812 [Necator americanus]|uniref:Uncharacterized protein n=1 Tax=Necator americanus TaxID=51031 RepID=A0ABR1DG20_NECAM